MYSVDYRFNHRALVRFLVLHKGLVGSSFSIPVFSKLFFFFSVRDLEDLNDVRLYNYLYFFRFFFGVRAFFTNYRFKAGFFKSVYDFKVYIFLRRDLLFFGLGFFVNDVLPFVDRDFLEVKLLRKYKVIFRLRDMNFFSEKKTNLGLFNLKDFLNLHFFMSKSGFSLAKLYFNNLKIFVEL